LNHKTEESGRPSTISGRVKTPKPIVSVSAGAGTEPARHKRRQVRGHPAGKRRPQIDRKRFSKSQLWGLTDLKRFA
jgi:hypothetical protein